MPQYPAQEPPVDLEAIAARLRSNGIVPPDDRARGTYVNGGRLLASLHWLRRERPLSAEPAHIMNLMEWTK